MKRKQLKIARMKIWQEFTNHVFENFTILANTTASFTQDLQNKIISNYNNIILLDSRVTDNTNNINILDNRVTDNINNIISLDNKVIDNTNNINILDNRVSILENKPKGKVLQCIANTINDSITISDGNVFIDIGLDIDISKILDNSYILVNSLIAIKGINNENISIKLILSSTDDGSTDNIFIPNTYGTEEHYMQIIGLTKFTQNISKVYCRITNNSGSDLIVSPDNLVSSIMVSEIEID